MNPYSTETLSFRSIPYLSQRDIAYKSNADEFQDFLTHLPLLDNIPNFVKAQSDFPQERRKLLSSVLSDQYSGMEKSELLVDNLDKILDPNTFAIVTAHQPCLFTGPLYFIYKIISAIKTAHICQQLYFDYHFVPVFVIGSEDHDFEEIKFVHLFGKKYQWNSKNIGGAVGEMKLDGIGAVINDFLAPLVNTPYADKIHALLTEAYKEDYSLSQATHRLLNALFGEKGLLIIDLNDKRLKKEAIDVFKAEIESPGEIRRNIDEKQSALHELGYDKQMHAREINLFYLNENSRNRIQCENGACLAGELQFTQQELQELLLLHPERFSPNVALRPIYQQMVLPSVAYIGGGAEVAYWMELKGVFSKLEIPFPMLLRRDSALWIGKSTDRLLKQTKLEVLDSMKSEMELTNAYLSEHAEENWKLTEFRLEADDFYQRLHQLTSSLDPSIDRSVFAMKSEFQKQLGKLESKLKKAAKQKHEVAIKRIAKLKAQLFPDGKLQERHTNFFEIYSTEGQEFLDCLYSVFDPFKNAFVVIRKDN
jgi:bacillithiol biosynthesis cysteine-adding enzyme BshC